MKPPLHFVLGGLSSEKEQGCHKYDAEAGAYYCGVGYFRQSRNKADKRQEAVKSADYEVQQILTRLHFQHLCNNKNGYNGAYAGAGQDEIHRPAVPACEFIPNHRQRGYEDKLPGYVFEYSSAVGDAD